MKRSEFLGSGLSNTSRRVLSDHGMNPGMRIMADSGEDMGPMPREGMYTLGFHYCAYHVSHICCKAADEIYEEGSVTIPATRHQKAMGGKDKVEPHLYKRPRRCFGLFRPPNDVEPTLCRKPLET